MSVRRRTRPLNPTAFWLWFLFAAPVALAAPAWQLVLVAWDLFTPDWTGVRTRLWLDWYDGRHRVNRRRITISDLAPCRV